MGSVCDRGANTLPELKEILDQDPTTLAVDINFSEKYDDQRYWVSVQRAPQHDKYHNDRPCYIYCIQDQETGYVMTWESLERLVVYFTCPLWVTYKPSPDNV
jgi:hypothetical protein